MADFETFVRLLDSPQPGERVNALESLHRLRVQEGWPTFGELVDRMKNSVPLDVHNRALQELEAARQQLAARWRIKFAMPFIDRRLMIAGAGAFVAVLAMWHFVGSSNAEMHRGASVSLLRLLPAANWIEGDTEPVISRINGWGDYWILYRGTLDASTHADAEGRLVARRCLALYAARAVSDGGVYLRPSPYNFFGRIRWALIGHECRLPRSATETKR